MEKVFNKYTKKRGKKSNPGEAIYKYEYIDRKTGKVETKETNIQEKIQSCAGLVDYKKMIKNGEYNNKFMGATSADYTSVPGDKVDIIDTINKVNQLSPEALNQILEALNGKPRETTSETTSETNKTDTPTPQTEPNDSGDPTKSTEGSAT